MANVKSVRIRLRNYSQERRKSLATFVSRLFVAGMAYFISSAPWACALLLVPRSGPSNYRFIVDLRPVKRFNIKRQFPMPNIE